MRVSRLKLSRKKNPKRYFFAPLLLFLSRFRYSLSFIGLSFVLIAVVLSWYLGYIAQLSHITSSKISFLAGQFGYRLNDIYIQGRVFTSRQDVLSAVDMYRGESSFKYPLKEIKGRLERMPWIVKAEVRRELPGALHIVVTERKPIALWQHQQRFYLVDENGMIIQAPMRKQFENLPVVVGQDAPQQTPKLLKLLMGYKEIMQRVTALVRINKRRWDLILNKTLTIKLPENQVEAAILRLNFLLEAKKINLNELMAIDLRLPKQLIAKVSPHTAERLKLKGTQT